MLYFVSTAKPLLRIDPERQVVQQGDSPTIQCLVTEGDQPYEIVWYKEGESNNDLTSPPPLPAHITHNGDGLLRFNQISMSDQGYYVCWAHNVVGEARLTAEVVVQGKAYVFCADDAVN